MIQSMTKTDTSDVGSTVAQIEEMVRAGCEIVRLAVPDNDAAIALKEIRKRVPDVPLVADASSQFLSRPIDVSRFGIVFACAQKNFGPAGLTAVIIRDDLIGHCSPRWPSMLDYKSYADTKSLYNTPATFAVTDAKILPKAVPTAGVIKLSGDPKTDQPTVDALRKQLKGKTIGIQSGTVYTKFINDGFKDAAGKVTKAIHHQNGQTIDAPKIQ